MIILSIIFKRRVLLCWRSSCGSSGFWFCRVVSGNRRSTTFLVGSFPRGRQYGTIRVRNRGFSKRPFLRMKRACSSNTVIWSCHSRNLPFYWVDFACWRPFLVFFYVKFSLPACLCTCFWVRWVVGWYSHWSNARVDLLFLSFPWCIRRDQLIFLQ